MSQTSTPSPRSRPLSKFALAEIKRLGEIHEKELLEARTSSSRTLGQAQSDARRYESYWQDEKGQRKKLDAEAQVLRETERSSQRVISDLQKELHHLRGAIVEYSLTTGHEVTKADKDRITELQKRIAGTSKEDARGPGMADPRGY